MTLSAIGIVALACIGFWTFGGIVLRLGGTLIALTGLVGLSLAGNASGLLVFALGASLWLAGHLHFRLRHGAFKSALAEWLCLAVASVCRRVLAIRGLSLAARPGTGEAPNPSHTPASTAGRRRGA